MDRIHRSYRQLILKKKNYLGQTVVNVIIDIIHDGGLILSHNKTVYKAGNLPITGTYYTNNSLDVLSNFTERIENIDGYSQQQKKAFTNMLSKLPKQTKRRNIKPKKYDNQLINICFMRM